MVLIWTFDFFYRVRAPAFTAWLASQIFNLRSNWALHKWNTVWLNFKSFLYLKKVVLHPFRYIDDVMKITAIEFQVQGYQIIEWFCLKINIPKEIYWISTMGVVGRRQKVPKFDFQSQFPSKSKSSESFSIIILLLKNTNLGAHFLLLAFFNNIN